MKSGKNISTSRKYRIILIAGVFLVWSLAVFATVDFSALSTPTTQTTGGKLKNTLDNIRATNGCQTGKYLQWFTSTGVLICKDINSLPSLSVAPTISNYTITGSGRYAQYLKNILHDCWDGRYVQGFDSNKKIICGDKYGTRTLNGVTISSPLNISVPSSASNPYADYFNNILSSSCVDGYGITGFDTNGNKFTTCASVNGSCANLPANATYANGGTSYTLSNAPLGTSLSANISSTPVGNTCNFKCKTNYTWNGSTCAPDTRQVACGGSVPANAVVSTAGTYTQTWNGSAWAPASTNWWYGQAACGFNCGGYNWNGSSCLPYVVISTYSYPGQTSARDRNLPPGAHAFGSEYKYGRDTFIWVGYRLIQVSTTLGNGDITPYQTVSGGNGYYQTQAMVGNGTDAYQTNILSTNTIDAGGAKTGIRSADYVILPAQSEFSVYFCSHHGEDPSNVLKHWGIK